MIGVYNKCPDCINDNMMMDYIHGLRLCIYCGHSEVIDYTINTAWSTFSDNVISNIVEQNIGAKNISHSPAKETLPVFKLEEVKNRVLTTKKYKKISKIAYQYDRLKVMSYKLSIEDDLFVAARKLFATVIKKKAIACTSLDAYIGAIFYVASRELKSPINPKKIQLVTLTKARILNSIIKVVQNISHLKENGGCLANYVPRLANLLKLSDDITRIASQIAGSADKCGIVGGKNPHSVAGASVIMACQILNMPIDMNQVEYYTKIKEQTIRGAYKNLYEHRAEIIPDDFLSLAIQLKPI